MTHDLAVSLERKRRRALRVMTFGAVRLEDARDAGVIRQRFRRPPASRAGQRATGSGGRARCSCPICAHCSQDIQQVSAVGRIQRIAKPVLIVHCAAIHERARGIQHENLSRRSRAQRPRDLASGIANIRPAEPMRPDRLLRVSLRICLHRIHKNELYALRLDLFFDGGQRGRVTAGHRTRRACERNHERAFRLRLR